MNSPCIMDSKITKPMFCLTAKVEVVNMKFFFDKNGLLS